MPDEFVLAKMRATRRLLTVPATDPDAVKLQGIAKVDCRPPPGATTEYVKPDQAVPLVIERFLQQEERTKIAILSLDIRPPVTDTIGALLAGLGIRPLNIYYNDPYRRLLNVVPCHTVEIFLRVRYDIYEIKIAAAVDLTVNNTAYPAGDELASFRVACPVQYRLETQTTFNPLCCEQRPERPPAERQSDWYPTGDFFDSSRWKPSKYGLGSDDFRLRLVPRFEMVPTFDED